MLTPTSPRLSGWRSLHFSSNSRVKVSIYSHDACERGKTHCRYVIPALPSAPEVCVAALLDPYSLADLRSATTLPLVPSAPDEGTRKRPKKRRVCQQEQLGRKGLIVVIGSIYTNNTNNINNTNCTDNNNTSAVIESILQYCTDNNNKLRLAQGAQIEQT